MIEVKECPACTSSSFTNIATCIDFTVSHETFSIRQCNNCKLAATTPRPEDSSLHRYYDSPEYISHSGKSSGGIGLIYKLARWYALRKKEKLVQKFTGTVSTLLDFGCGTGEFLQFAKTKGWQIHGIEPAEAARKKAIQLTKAKIFTSLQQAGDLRINAITAWHVLEHVSDPVDTLTKFNELLKEDGTIFIAVPNYLSPDSKKYKNFWAGYDVPRHTWHFSKDSIVKLLAATNFRLLSIVPMKLDAYYISLLSEKYRNNNKITLSVLVNAFISGLTSNLKASKTTNHSSLIYIARKS
jgi:2-polyprenyl-3-methyl-5-hydroxy-6-metoxy-1,4-benzoquinol methylase